MWIDDFSLLEHNTFGIDARCARFAEYASEKELRTLILTLREKFPHDPVLCVGQGSNLLFTSDFPGTVLHSTMCEVSAVGADEVLVTAGSGRGWDDFVAHCVGNGWYGLENLSYIPGTVGASAVQNIGAYGAEAEQFITQVRCLDLQTGEAHVFSHDELHYGYRQSAFKQELKGKYVVTAVTYRLSKTFTPHTGYGSLGKELAARGLEEDLTPEVLRALIIEIRKAKLPELAELGSAGSFFMNPVISQTQFDALQHEYPDIPHYPAPNGVKVPAGWLIERCGWKGRRLGAAGVYEKQALVLVNHGGATGGDIVNLSDAVRADVKAKFGIDIHPEVNFI